jgi:hypothetical protein
MAFKKDTHRILTVALYDVLSDIDVDVYNVLPENVDNPFIYIGAITSFDFSNKCSFITEGTVDVEMHTGANGWNGSMSQLYEYLAEIKAALQPSKDSVLDLGTSYDMHLWKIQADSGLIVYDPINRLMSSTTTYEFSIVQAIGYKDRVEDNDGTIESINCVPLELR